MSDKSKIFSSKIQNPKGRIIIVIVSAIIVVSALTLFWNHKSKVIISRQGSAQVEAAPGISSVPGAGDPSNEYIKTQKIQNGMQAREARKNATSDVPTITRPSFIGNPDEFGTLAPISPTDKTTCPLQKTTTGFKPNPASCSPENLKLAKQSGVRAGRITLSKLPLSILKGGWLQCR